MTYNFSRIALATPRHRLFTNSVRRIAVKSSYVPEIRVNPPVFKFIRRFDHFLSRNVKKIFFHKSSLTVPGLDFKVPSSTTEEARGPSETGRILLIRSKELDIAGNWHEPANEREMRSNALLLKMQLSNTSGSITSCAPWKPPVREKSHSSCRDKSIRSSSRSESPSAGVRRSNKFNGVCDWPTAGRTLTSRLLWNGIRRTDITIEPNLP